MPQPALELSMLEAVQLFNGKPPAEWTTEELAAFRLRLEKSPNLVATVGGPQAVERRLKDVEAALAKASQKAVVAAAQAREAAAATPRKPLPVRRIAEAAVFLVLIGTAGFFLIRHLADMSAKADPTAKANESAKKSDPNHPGAAPQATAPAVQPTAKQPATSAAASTEPTDSEAWRGWAIKVEDNGQWSLKREWDISNPGMEVSVDWLVLEGGKVRLSQRRKLADVDRWLEIRGRTQATLHKGERIVVGVGGQEIDQIRIGAGEARWPAFVSLEKFAGQEVDLEITYEPGGKGAQLVCKGIQFAPQKRQIAKRINCGGPAIESADGDWEADDNKSHLYVTSAGTRTFTIKEPAPGTGDLQQMYQDERWANQFVAYKVAVGPGQFDVVLHFAETNRSFQAEGKRVFDIILNEHTVAEKFDVFKAAGGPGPLAYRQRVEAVDGEITIRLQGNPTGPAIKGIEIHKVQ